MDSKPLVSVLIPTYNCADTLPIALGSLLYQTYSNWEAIVVDDGSEDHTEEIIKDINDERIQYIKLEKNYGTAVARQTALDSATGKYVCMLDADDWYLPGKMENQLKELVENDTSIISSEMILTKDDNTLVGKTQFGKSGTAESVPHGPTMFKKSLAENFEFNTSLQRGGDQELIQFLLNKEEGKILETPYYVYRNAYADNYKLAVSHYYKFVRVFSKLDSIGSLIKIFRSLSLSGLFFVASFLNIDLKQANKHSIELTARERKKVNNFYSKLKKMSAKFN